MNDDATYRDALRTGLKLHWYEIFSVLGQGGYGITYLGRDTNLNKSVAIKEYLPRELAIRDGNNTVQPRNGEQGEFYKIGLKRFIKEAQTLARFKHPNIVQVQSFFEANNTAYMVMEYERGHSLASFVENKRFRVESVLTDILLRVLDGLEQVHRTGFIHRDIKPANIFLRSNGSPVLIDFGSARFTGHGQASTLTSMVSPGFAPIEQYQGSEEHEGPWSDIYALGATCYRLVSGRSPVDALKRSIGITVDGEDPYEPLADADYTDFSTRFRDAVDVAMRFNWRHRPQSIKEWREVLVRGATAPRRAVPAVRIGKAANAVPKALPGDEVTAPSERIGGARAKALRGPAKAPRKAPTATGPHAVKPHVKSKAALTRAESRDEIAMPATEPPQMRNRRPLILTASVTTVVMAGVIAWSLFEPPNQPTMPAADAQQIAIVASEQSRPAVPDAEQEAAARAAAEQEAAAAEQAREQEAARRLAAARAAAENLAREREAADRRIREQAEAERKAQEQRRAAEAAIPETNSTPVLAATGEASEAAPAASAGRSDIEIISELINEFERAFESRDLGRLERTANLSQGKRELLEQVFRNYSLIEVSISDLALLGAKGSASAKMTVTRLLDHDGNRVIPGAWKEQQLVTRKRTGRWQKFEW